MSESPGMRRTIPIILACLLFAACVQRPPVEPAENDDPTGRPQSNDDGEAPQWTVNDHWVVRQYNQATPEETIQSYSQYVEAIDELESAGTTMDAFRVISSELNSTTWFRKSDLALMKEDVRSGETPGITVFDPPCALYSWPLTSGMKWNGTCARSGAGTGVLQFDATVGEPETIDNPIRNFTARPIHFTGDDGGTPIDRTEYVSTDACYPIRIVTKTSEATIVEDLIAFDCESTGTGA